MERRALCLLNGLVLSEAYARGGTVRRDLAISRHANDDGDFSPPICPQLRKAVDRLHHFASLVLIEADIQRGKYTARQHILELRYGLIGPALETWQRRANRFTARDAAHKGTGLAWRPAGHDPKQ
jgi:hypothetical protein